MEALMAVVLTAGLGVGDEDPPLWVPGWLVGWNVDARADFNHTSGNTNTTDVGGHGSMERALGGGLVTLEFETLLGRAKTSSGTGTNKRRFNVDARWERDFSERFYGYASAEVLHDKPAQIDLRWMVGGGVGYRWPMDEKFELTTEAGPGWLREDHTSDSAVGVTEATTVRLAGDWTWHWTDRTRLREMAEIVFDVSDSDDYLTEFETSVRTDLSEHVFFEWGLEVRRDSVPSTDEKNDLRVFTGVGIDF